jgi:2-oxoglutarate dehydrogenase E1 component
MINHSYLSNADVDSIEHMYQQYQDDPGNVDFGWQKFFEGFDLAYGKTGVNAEGVVSDDMLKEISVLQLINEGYRMRGHLFTSTNPVRERRKYIPTLALENFGLSEADLEKTFNAGVEIGIGPAKLKDIVSHLEQTYCSSIGAEFMYILNPDEKNWLKEKMESTKNAPKLTLEQKRLILEKLNQAVVFENFLHTKYIGQKRFSLEGLETLIPALDAVIEFGAAAHNIEEFVIGMAHRGRLNVLANIMNKKYEEIFSEFEGKGFEDAIFEGDVKYHMGFASVVNSSTKKEVRLTLCPNPSHLESVNPVVHGMARAKLDGKYDNNVNKIAPILIHGDASVAGQGVVYETIQMAGLDAYNVGGTVHIVTNNQIGFTTNYIDGRTSIYCTDVAKTTKCPVFHVNGDDVEAIVHTVKMAMEYRQKFHKDVFIDLLGYRKYGHNEGDEPRFTQPKLYATIAKHPNPREIYAAKLAEGEALEASMAKEMQKEFKALLQEKLDHVRTDQQVITNNLPKNTWAKIRHAQPGDFKNSPKTSITQAKFKSYFNAITHLPEGFKAFKKVEKLFKDRASMLEKDSFDWAMGELMAYASLLAEGNPVRMSGQDCERGTFSHRHAVLTATDAESEYIPLNHVSDKQAEFEIYNSNLSEMAVLGFEYGYAMSNPYGLTIWEAQFGDFANGAQVIIDQYIASGETKWQRYNGITLLLPHGHEGQGPEHSSARPERYLQLCAANNMQVINPTTPANFFHALRRQLKRDFRVPLIVMTPKSLLRHPKCTSTQSDFVKRNFQEIIDDSAADVKKIKRVVLCTGKVYYDLLAKKEEENREDVSLVRIEQLYPLAETQLAELAKKYGDVSYLWVQEEPKNMGAWMHLLRYDLPMNLKLVSRKSSASTATGYAKVHAAEQAELVRRAFDLSLYK